MERHSKKEVEGGTRPTEKVRADKDKQVVNKWVTWEMGKLKVADFMVEQI